MKAIKAFRGFVWRVLHTISPALEHQVSKRVSKNHCDNWPERTRRAQASSDNAFIPRVADAGELRDGIQIMHNGIKVVVGSYYGKGPVGLLRKNRGVHEPQEERVFQEVLKVIRPGSTMLELGAYWAFYSLWFCQEVPAAKAFMVEPVEANLEFGRKNFALNGREGHFTQAYVGASPGRADDGTKVISVDTFLAEHGIGDLAILHSDVQGFEVDMLRGAQQSMTMGKIQYAFISTHTAELHQQCEQILASHGFVTIASVPPAESYSVDGVLVARSASAQAVPPMELSRRRAK